MSQGSASIRLISGLLVGHLSYRPSRQPEHGRVQMLNPTRPKTAAQIGREMDRNRPDIRPDLGPFSLANRRRNKETTLNGSRLISTERL
jgi:hypothetical protein